MMIKINKIIVFMVMIILVLPIFTLSYVYDGVDFTDKNSTSINGSFEFDELVNYSISIGLTCEDEIQVFNYDNYTNSTNVSFNNLEADSDYKINVDIYDKAGNYKNNCYTVSTEQQETTVTGVGEVNISFQESLLSYFFFGLFIWVIIMVISFKTSNYHIYLIGCIFGFLFGLIFLSDNEILNLSSKFFMIMNGYLIWVTRKEKQ